MHKLISDKLFKAIPGPWEQHSFSVADNAKRIAQKAGLDAETAYVMGLLHDIGRGAGVSGIRHIFDGYDLMMSLGEPGDRPHLPDPLFSK